MSKLFQPIHDTPEEGGETWFPIGYVSRGGLQNSGYDVGGLSDEELSEIAEDFGDALLGSGSGSDIQYAFFKEFEVKDEEEDEE